ncbi:hypothetical protein E4U21_003548 [Claviceps maximensis]|nr:hypothetical protein E4U21_003548 [Claviceps maximensis]
MSQTPSPRPTRYPLVSPTHIGSLALNKRGLNDCGETQHSCLDVQRPDSCCDNTSYCYINAQNEARCCPIGSNCIADSPCSSQAYYCTVTLTTTFPFSLASAVAGTTSVATSVTTEQGCCGRKCPQTSFFLCPPDLGGKCCPFGAQCQAGGNCLLKKTAASTNATASASTSASASVCSLPASSNGGATSCPDTSVDSSDNDADADNDASDSPAELSVGVKAAVGICISVSSLVVLGAAWFFFRRWIRRRRRKGDISNRVELNGCAVLQESKHNRPHARRQQQISAFGVAGGFTTEADDGMPQSPRDHIVPVEIASVEAVSPVSHNRTYSNWASIQPECPRGGVSELEGSPVYEAEQHLPSPLTPPSLPPPHLAFSSANDYPSDKKDIF